MPRAAIGLGSNEGDRLLHLRTAVEELARLGRIVAVSSLYETEPVGGPEQPRYLNAVVLVETDLPPLDLLAGMQEIETSAGRVREVRWGPRTLDLDLLVYGRERIQGPTLEVPHPRAAHRRFVLAPLADVWAEAELGGRTAAEALGGTEGQEVRRWEGDWRHETPRMGRAAPAWLAAQAALLVLVAAALVLWGEPGAPTWRRLTGGLLATAGVVLVGWGSAALGPQLSPYPQPRQGGQLVESGPYRLVRHPIYGGILLGLLGAAIWMGSWPAIALTAALGVFFRAKARVEERAMAVGVAGYRGYLERVGHRFLPWIW